MYYESNNNYLAHHGILGQKWGVRRFQNKDGTRTPLGRKRELENNKVDHDKLVKSTDAKELYKNRDQLSDRELQDRLNRLRNEDALRQMANAKKKANNGQSTSKKVLQKIGEKSAEMIAGLIVGATVGAMTDKIKKQGAGKTIENALDMMVNGYEAVKAFKDNTFMDTAIDWMADPWMKID